MPKNTPPSATHQVLYLLGRKTNTHIARYVHDLAVHVDPKHFSVVLYSNETSLNEQIQHAGQRAYTTDINQGSWITQLRNLRSVLKTERPDIIHSQDPHTALLCGLAGRWCRIPKIIYTAHHWPSGMHVSYYQRFIHVCQSYLAVLSSHYTIVPSRTLLQKMQWPLAKHRLKVIHPGRSIGAMYNKQEARSALATISNRADLPVQKKAQWIGVVTELHPIRRLDLLLEAASKLLSQHPHTYLVIIGDGEARKTLQQHTDSLPVADQIFILGAIHEAARFFHAFDLFILPYQSGVYSYVLHEAGLARLPVVAIETASTRDVITDHKTGLLIPSDNSSALVSAIHTLLTHHAQVEELRHNLKEHLQPHTAEKMVQATTALYTITS